MHRSAAVLKASRSGAKIQQNTLAAISSNVAAAGFRHKPRFEDGATCLDLPASESKN